MACGCKNIAFLADQADMAISKISEANKFISDFTETFVGIGNNKLRTKLLEQLRDDEYIIPILIHPSSYISPTAIIERELVIEPKAIVNVHSVIGCESIISVGAIVNS